MDFDQAFRAVGEFGRYQRIIFSGLCFSNLVCMWQMVLIVFVGAMPEFGCYRKGVFIPTNNSCAENCDVLKYESSFSSIASEWDLICDKAYHVSMVQSIFMAGVLLGAFIFGLISDKFGRKITLFYALSATAFSSMAGAWCSDLTSFMVLRFITGFHNSGTILCTFVITMELIGDSWRTFCGTILQVSAATGIMMYALLGYVWTDWRTLVFVVSLLTLPSLLLYPLILESPRWLYARGRIHDAELVLDKIGQKNKLTVKKVILAEPETASGRQTGTVMALVQNSILCRYTAILIYTWFVCSCVYYGLTISAGSLGSSMYSSVALSGLVEVPANLLVMALLACLGRRSTMSCFLIIGGICCLVITWLPEEKSSSITLLAMLGKLFITGSFTLVYIWSAEVFPTFVRNAALGLMSVGARIGGIISPLIILLGDYSLPLPYLVYGVLSVTAGLLCSYLPETRNQPLPETTDDLLQLGGHFVDTDDKTWSTELLVEERSVGARPFKGKSARGKGSTNSKVS